MTMFANERRMICLAAGIGMILCLMTGCKNSRGPEPASGAQLILLSSSITNVSVPDTIDTVMIDDLGMQNGKQFTLAVQSPEIRFLAQGPGQRFRDQFGQEVPSLHRFHNGETSTELLRYDTEAPSSGAILNGPGNYTLTLYATPTDSIWEIDRL